MRFLNQLYNRPSCCFLSPRLVYFLAHPFIDRTIELADPLGKLLLLVPHEDGFRSEQEIETFERALVSFRIEAVDYWNSDDLQSSNNKERVLADVGKHDWDQEAATAVADRPTSYVEGVAYDVLVGCFSVDALNEPFARSEVGKISVE